MKKITFSMAKIFIATFLTLNFNFVKAQQFKFHAEYDPSWYGPGFIMNQDIAGYVKTTLQATSATDQFVIEADNGYNRWKKNGTSLTTNINEVGYYEFYPNAESIGISDNFLTTPATVNHFYSFRLKNVGYQSTSGVMMETNNAPVLFASANAVSQNPLANAVSQNVPVVITFNLASAPSPQEKVYVRYSTDGFVTSTVVEGTFIGGPGSTSGTVTIPGQAVGAVVNYYLLTTTFTLTNPLSVEADLATLNLENNQGINYSYTVVNSSQTTANITFRVNMTGQIVSPNGVKLAGSFNNFNTTATPMTNAGNNIYEATLPLLVGSQQIFKYVNGSDFELIDASCGILGSQTVYDRFVNVPANNTTLDLVCFNSCTNSCSTNPNTVNVTFRVNMTGQVVSPNGVNLAGSFNNFNTTATPMTNSGNNIYEATLPLVVGSQQIFKYVNGSDFELIDAACGILGSQTVYDRFVNVPANNTTLDLVCFNSCTNSCSANTNTVNVTFRVNMSQQIVSLDGVHIAGTFNGFSTTANEMTSVGAGIYETTIAIEQNTTVRYKFLNGTNFSVQEIVPQACGVDNGVGGFDRNLTVFAEPLVLPTVCFGECINCVVPNTINLTFRVNMSQQTVSAAGVFVAGTFNGFNASANPMLSIGGGIYEATIAIDAGVTAQYVFINGNGFTFQESVPATCGVNNGFGGYNRSIIAPNTTTILPTVCFSSCEDCIAPSFSNITFRVNMSQQTVGTNGVHVSGSFNNWNPSGTPMTLTTNGIYEATVAIASGTTVQYKFINGNTFATQETVPSACGVANTVGGFDREIVVGTSDDTLAAVCFGECSNCVFNALANVTFRVNMSLELVSADGVHLAGSFNGFSTTANPMTLVGNGIYETTVAIDTTSTIQYVFLNGITFNNQESVTSACGVDNGFGGFNRSYIVPESNSILPTVCFSSCSDCVLPALAQVTFYVNMSQENISAQGVFLSGSFNSFSTTANPMTNIGGGIFKADVSLDTTAIIQYKFVNGTVFESVSSICGVDDGFNGFNRILSVPQTDVFALPTVCFSSCEDCITTSILAKNSTKFSFSPNPTHSIVTITNGESLKTITVVDNLGKELMFLSNNNSSLVNVDLSSLSEGIYFVKCLTDKETITQKIIKQ
jgi:hypothetical protein